MTTIPASEVADVVPSVLGAGGSSLDVIVLMLTSSTRIPIGTVPSFPDVSSVEDYFGSTSTEAGAARNYFAGYDNSPKKPASLLMAQYNALPVSAFLRGGDISGISLATLQSYSGLLSVTIDGVVKSGTVNLSAATSFSNAAASIAATLGVSGVQTAIVTGSMGAVFTASGSGTSLTVTGVSGVIHANDALSGGTGVPANTIIVNQVSGVTGGAGVYTTNNPTTINSAAGNTTSATFEVTGLTSGTIGFPQVMSGTGVTDNTYITALGSGTGGIGSYTTGTVQFFPSQTVTIDIPGVAYDSVSGAFVVNSGTTGPSSTITFGSGAISSALLLTALTGAVLSQGAAAAVPAAFMDGVVNVTTDWVTFMTLFDPDNGSGNTVKLAFAAWNTLQNNRYAYVDWDTDITPTQGIPATASQGFILGANGNSGTSLQYAPDVASGVSLAAFLCGAAASIDFTQTNGRITFAFKSQAGMLATVTTAAVANNLGGSPQGASRGNGYNFYGIYGAAASSFAWYQRGFVTGDFKWFDSYINQIWLNNALQDAILNLENNAPSIPYNVSGAVLVEQALADPIAAGLNFGAFAPGTISASQIAAVNAAAGANVAPALQAQGYYLQVGQAPSATRAARTSPPCTFWYLDRGSIQSLTLNSVAVQ